MAGTIFGLGLSHQFDSAGKLARGCKLYIFEAGTLNPVNAYKEYGLANVHPWPIEADSAGRIPSFWLDDGTYRVRLTTSGGVILFDNDNVVALGPSAGGGGGGGDTTNPYAVFQSGDFLWKPVTGTRSGWVRANARTIGSATSGATERANSDCETLFGHLWNNYSNTYCPVTGGRGVSAAADWSANKLIATPDLRGRSPFGLDDMGNSAASRLTTTTITTGDASTGMSSGGAQTQTLDTTQIPSHSHDGTSDTESAHTHPYRDRYLAAGYSAYPDKEAATDNNGHTGVNANAGNGPYFYYIDSNTSAGTAHSHDFTTDPSGGGLAHNNMPPFALGTWYIFLG